MRPTQPPTEWVVRHLTHGKVAETWSLITQLPIYAFMPHTGRALSSLLLHFWTLTAVWNSEWNIMLWKLNLLPVCSNNVERTYSVSDMSRSVQDTKTMGNSQDFSNIKCNVLSSTQKNSSDLNNMGRVPCLWANTIQNKHKSCQYCIYHFLSLPSGYNLFSVIFLAEAKSNLCTALTIEKTVAVNCMHKKQPKFSLLYVHQFLAVNSSSKLHAQETT